jgi:hypothetical protein
VALWDLAPQVADVETGIGQDTGKLVPGIRTNVFHFAAVQEAVRETEDRLEPISHLVHSAAWARESLAFLSRILSRTTGLGCLRPI